MARFQDIEKFHNFLLCNRKPKKYLEERGFSLDTITEFQVGYIPPFENHWMSGRIIVPIFDSYGRFLDISGRKLPPVTNGDIKWINGKFNYTSIGDTSKKHHLYNLNKAKKHIVEKKFVVITEGYFDVFASWQAGIKNVVATCGTNFSYTHLCLLLRYCDLFIFAFDADSAGEQAKNNAISMAEGIVAYDFLSLPDGMDIDDFIKKYGDESFLKMVKNKI
jgi:DNA primase